MQKISKFIYIFFILATFGPCWALDDADDSSMFDEIILEKPKATDKDKNFKDVKFQEPVLIEEDPKFKAGIFTEKIVQKYRLDEAKTIKYENKFINEITPILYFQGRFDADVPSKGHSRFIYPLEIDAGGDLKFGESKNKIRVTSNIARDVEDMSNKFFGKLSDVYYEREIFKNHYIRLGNSRIPLGLEGSESQFSLLLPERSMIAKEFSNARATGVRLRGNFGYLDYDFGGYSSTRYMQSFRDGQEFAGWINYKPFYNKNEHPLRHLKVGGGINTGERDGSYTVSGAAISWNNEKFLANLEYAYADGSNSKEYNPLKRDGFYSTVGYNINEKVQILGRYETFDPNKDGGDDLIQNYTIGLNYYVLKQRLRFSLDYTFTTDENDNKYKNSVMFMTQIMI